MEDLAPSMGRSDCSSAEDFAAAIKTTFEEEKELGMVAGPFTPEEAARVCRCTVDELCPGPMAAIDEGDKVRTIYDGL